MFTILATAAVKSAMVFALAWAVAKTMRQASAAARHLVWTSAMAVALMLPAASAWLPALQIPAPAALRETTAVFAVNATAGGEPENAPLIRTNRTSTPTSLPALPPWRTLVLLAWATGTVVIVLQMLLGYAAIWRLRRSSNRTTQRVDGIDGVEILESSAGTMPMTTGILKPAVFLPADSDTWPGGRRKAVLAHELAHVHRGDSATQLLARTAVALYWWNPLAWLAWREFLKERERAADDLVLASGVNASDYAAHLLEIARDFSTPSAMAVAMARPSQFEGRLLAILDSRVSRKGSGRRSVLIAAACAVAVMAPLAAVRAQEPTALPADLQATIRSAQSQRDPGMLEGIAGQAEKHHKFDIARTLLTAAAEIHAQVSGASSPEYGAAILKLADLDKRQHGLVGAAKLYSQAADLLKTGPDAAAALVSVGEVAIASKDLEGAASAFTRARTADSAHAAAATMWLANVHARRSNVAEADGLYKSAIALAEPGSMDAALARTMYARFLVKEGRNEEAEQYTAQARQSFSLNGAQPNQITSTTFKIGGDVKPPSVLSKTEPEYAEEARVAGLEGTVVLSMVIGTDGTAQDIVVTRPAGMGLDDKAIEAVGKWKFKPGMRGGEAVPVIAQVEVNFHLL